MKQRHVLYEVSPDAYQHFREIGAIQAYVRQRDTAKSRGIEWRFTFVTWWAMWDASGKWALRGRTKGLGGWEMSRPGDVGPYSPDNVVICTHKENMAEVQARLAARRPPAPAKRKAVGRFQGLFGDAARLERAKELFRSGASLAAIGAELGLHRSAVQRALEKAGVVVQTAVKSRHKRAIEESLRAPACFY
jgi:hypothetical protein